MKIKKGDTVKVIVGKDKGKTGKVLQVLPALGRVSVEKINISFKYLRGQKSQQKTQAGQKIEFPSPIQVSNLMVICPKCGKPTRVGARKGEKEKKNRICKKCKEVI